MFGCSKPTMVTMVIDGGTIDVIYNGKSEHVKLLGVSLSNRAHKYYTDAKIALSEMVDGKKVKLEFENPGKEERNEQGQLICYVYLKGTNVNVEMVRQGFCRFCSDRGACRMLRMFEKAESEARINKEGIWK